MPISRDFQASHADSRGCVPFAIHHVPSVFMAQEYCVTGYKPSTVLLAPLASNITKNGGVAWLGPSELSHVLCFLIQHVRKEHVVLLSFWFKFLNPELMEFQSSIRFFYMH